MTEQRKRKLRRQLQESRARLYQLNIEFALPLRDMIFVAVKNVKRMSTNGKCIYFDPDWVQKLGHRELDFMLSHQLMHIALGHIERPRYYTGDRFHLACDIVANSHLEKLGWKYEKLPYVGKIYCETFFPAKSGCTMTAQEALGYIPFDPAVLKAEVRRRYMIDSEEWWDKKADCGESGEIVLSPQDEEPDDLCGYEKTTGGNRFFVEKEIFLPTNPSTLEEANQKNVSAERWDLKAAQALSFFRAITDNEIKTGTEEDFRERVWQRTGNGTMDWRKLLESFIQEEVFDYSFLPPDRRMQEDTFLLPDYNVQKEIPRKVIFMVDTSGSINENTLVDVYDEICNAIAQFQGGLRGAVCYFDTAVRSVTEFSDITDFIRICPKGGGGTNYHNIFRYIRESGMSDEAAHIVIFTDGNAEFPEEAEAGQIPVLWLFSERGAVPPWGKYAYLS